MGDDYDAQTDTAPTSGFSNTDDARADAISNRDDGEYNPNESRIETGATRAEQAQAWHAARDDYEKEEGLPDRHESKWW